MESPTVETGGDSEPGQLPDVTVVVPPAVVETPTATVETPSLEAVVDLQRPDVRSGPSGQEGEFPPREEAEQPVPLERSESTSPASAPLPLSPRSLTEAEADSSREAAPAASQPESRPLPDPKAKPSTPVPVMAIMAAGGSSPTAGASSSGGGNGSGTQQPLSDFRHLALAAPNVTVGQLNVLYSLGSDQWSQPPPGQPPMPALLSIIEPKPFN
ncbi:hypothetical protein N6H14_03820 [Paenibacillus sp. CC-CFT747]|nr:hypothetical protein N6H14_03820 [Paenibacillus sp. CC-CFT747]